MCAHSWVTAGSFWLGGGWQYGGVKTLGAVAGETGGNAELYQIASTRTKCSYTDQSKRAPCSNGNVGNCGAMPRSACYEECLSSAECTHFSHESPDQTGVCILCTVAPDEAWDEGVHVAVSYSMAGQ